MPTTKFDDMDIREITRESVHELSQLTGRTVASLLEELFEAQKTNHRVYMMVNHPTFRTKGRAKLEKCHYDHTWSDETGWSQMCRVHNKPTWHNFQDDPEPPCIEIDPKPDKT